MTDFMKNIRFKKVWVAECKQCGNYYTDVNDEVDFDTNKKLLKERCQIGKNCCDCYD